MKILIVDDCRISTLQITGMLAQTGYDNVIAATGFDEAMTMLHSAITTDTPFDLILMDIGLPGTDGIAATPDNQGATRIRRRPDHNDHKLQRRNYP